MNDTSAPVNENLQIWLLTSRNTIPGPTINAMLLKYTVLILKMLLFLTCYECKILSPIPW
jgi:hypothetical protein